MPPGCVSLGFVAAKSISMTSPPGGDADMPFSEMRCDAIRYGVAGGNWVWSDGRCRSPIDRVS